MKRFTATLLAGATLVIAGAALAHPDIVTANPAPNATIAASPSELRLTFSEPLFVNFSGVKLLDGRGKPVAVGKPKLAAGDNKVLVVPLKGALPAGAYTVQWHAVSADTHRITGTYRFTVR